MCLCASVKKHVRRLSKKAYVASVSEEGGDQQRSLRFMRKSMREVASSSLLPLFDHFAFMVTQ